MNVTVVGAGRVGLVVAASLADMGNHVLCLDVDAGRIAQLRAGRVPLFEPGLAGLLQRNADAGRLAFSTDAAAAVAHAPLQFIAVDTAPTADGGADVTNVLAAAAQIGRHMTGFTVAAIKSTVPVGTAQRAGEAVRAELARRFPRGDAPECAVVSNPEFLKEGAAVADFARPDRIILGVDAGPAGASALGMLRALYAPFTRNHERIRVMEPRSAEFTKYAANAMLATRISFMNELANLAEAVGADIELVRQGMGADPRIGHSFLYAGAGYGGSCLPKDVQALVRAGEEHGLPLRILQAVEAVNQDQRQLLAGKVLARLGPDLAGKTVAVWGLAFKPETDDMRNAPSRALVTALLRAGARVVAHDPAASEEALRALQSDLAATPALIGGFAIAPDPAGAVLGADALVVVTEWKMYRSPDWAALRQAMRSPIVFDGRNLYAAASVEAAGVEYHGVGRRGPSRPAR
jgi:UDPglucose 6-dehydrogenase